jgi:hypothetical protein
MVAIRSAPQDVETKIDLGRSQIVGCRIHYISHSGKLNTGGERPPGGRVIFKEDPGLVKRQPASPPTSSFYNIFPSKILMV